MRLLIIEDDATLADALLAFLTREGHAVDHVATLTDARGALLDCAYDALLLDLGLPDGDGINLLRSLRAQRNKAPVLVLTARSGLHERIDGLDAGADDYLSKPFRFEELSARLRAVARRSSNHGSNLDAQLQVGTLVIDLAARQASIGNNPLQLTARELQLLLLLAESAGRNVTRARIEQALYSNDHEPSSNAIEVFISTLRKKLPPGSIVTERGIGWHLVPDAF